MNEPTEKAEKIYNGLADEVKNMMCEGVANKGLTNEEVAHILLSICRAISFFFITSIGSDQDSINGLIDNHYRSLKKFANSDINDLLNEIKVDINAH